MDEGPMLYRSTKSQPGRNPSLSYGCGSQAAALLSGSLRREIHHQAHRPRGCPQTCLRAQVERKTANLCTAVGVEEIRLLIHPPCGCELLSVRPGLDELDRGDPLVRTVRPIDVLVDPLVVLEEDLGLEHGVEALAVQELVAWAAVEVLDQGVLPRAARVDEHGVGAVETTPVSHPFFGIGLAKRVDQFKGTRSISTAALWPGIPTPLTWCWFESSSVRSA
jgi:hypothetical protein